MIDNIPVRSDSQIWEKSDAEEYTDREVWETDRIESVSRTTEKEEYILKDPNIAEGKITNYVPKTAIRTKTIEIGDYSHQSFSGQWSQREKAAVLKRRDDLIVAVVKSLKICNDCEIVESELTADRIFKHIFYGE